jgi:cytochrome P450
MAEHAAGLPAIVPEAQRLDPYAYFAEMRRHRPVAYEPETEGWHVYRYDDALAVLSDPATFSSQRSLNPRHAGPPSVPTVLTTDPPRHRRLRDLVSRAFTPRRVAELEGRMVEITRDLLDRVAGPGSRGEMDVVADLAAPLPVIVIAELLGIPAEDRDRFKRWSDAIAAATEGGDPEVEPSVADVPAEVLGEMGGYLARILDQRRAAPRDDLISGLVTAEIEGQRLTELEVIAFCILLLVAGNVTTTNLIGNAVRTLLTQPPTGRPEGDQVAGRGVEPASQGGDGAGRGVKPAGRRQSPPPAPAPRSGTSYGSPPNGSRRRSRRCCASSPPCASSPGWRRGRRRWAARPSRRGAG